jgi:hypothetical protein
MDPSINRYSAIIEKIFFNHFGRSEPPFPFDREEINSAAEELKLPSIKNMGDLIYSFRYRTNFPESITKKAPLGFKWIIRPKGRSKYEFALTPKIEIVPDPTLIAIKIPNATPGIIQQHSLNDEQALLAKIRYNRLIDIFTGVACYSLQNHLRTSIRGLGQVETDELYVGIDKSGAHYIIPVQAKSKKDKIGIIQIEQDLALCKEKFPNLVYRLIATQFIDEDLIALFEFEETDEGIKKVSEKHYRLVQPDKLTEKDLSNYRKVLV